MRTQHCKCRQCGKQYVYEHGGDKGYDTELCSSFCDGIETGMKRKQKEIDELKQRIDELENPIPSMGELLGLSQL